MRLSVLIRSVLLVCILSVAAFGAGMDYNFGGPVVPTAPFVAGLSCIGSNPTPCVAGSVGDYGIFSLELQQLSPGSTTWTMTLHTNYPNDPAGLPNLPTNSTPVSELAGGIPPEKFGTLGPAGLDAAGNQINFAIGDLLFSVNTGTPQVPNNHFYALVLSPHDGLVTGDVYQANATNAICDPVYQAGACAFLTSGQVLRDLAGQPLSGAPRPNVPVWLSPDGLTGSSLIGTSSVLTMAKTGSDATQAPGLYTIVDTFNITNSSNLLQTSLVSGSFLTEISSYVCANGVIIGNGTTGSAVPEPRALFFLIPAILLFARRFARPRSVQNS